MKEDDSSGPPNRELYALLHLSPDASDEEIRKAYRQWAQIYHPDKYQSPHMKETATENFQRICEAYEILTDETKRQIYDIYGMEGLTSGLELGPKLNKAEEVKEELERLRRMKEQEKEFAHFRPAGTVMAKLSLPQFLDGDGIMTGMAMTSQLNSQLSKRNAIGFAGTLLVNQNSGLGGASVVFNHQVSPHSSIELMATAGPQSVIGVQMSRNLSVHSTATMGLAMSLEDNTFNLSNRWSRQLSESTSGDIQLMLGSESSISAGWQKKEEKMSGVGELKIGTTSFGATASYTRHFSSNSHGRISGTIGSSALEMEIGGGRKLSNFGTIRTMYSIGIQGISWRIELRRGTQKLSIPILLSSDISAMFATGAFFIPTSLYLILKKFVVKPYILKREKQKALENRDRTSAQVREAKSAAEKAQQLLQNVANRKKNKQQETGGLVITRAVYGDLKALKKEDQSRQTNEEDVSPVIDVTLPLNFLVSDSGKLKLHEGVKKSGIMGFCDPCPGQPKQLHIEYTYGGNDYEVVVDDYEELIIPREVHRVRILSP